MISFNKEEEQLFNIGDELFEYLNLNNMIMYSTDMAYLYNFIDKDGLILGKHKGIIYYTIGQRKGLGISSDTPLYVCKIDPQSGNIVLGSNDELLSREVTAVEFNWISGDAPKGEFRCKAKVRYRQTEQRATAFPLGEDTVRILFDTPQRAITPGQAAVLYDGDTVLGGGTIK